MRTLLVGRWALRVITARESTEESVDDGARAKEIAQGAQRGRSRTDGGGGRWLALPYFKVRPCVAEKGSRPIRQDEDKMQAADAMSEADDLEGPTVQRVTLADDGDPWRKVLGVGSVSCVRSTRSTTGG